MTTRKPRPVTPDALAVATMIAALPIGAALMWAVGRCNRRKTWTR